jgi:hypothetical protein
MQEVMHMASLKKLFNEGIEHAATQSTVFDENLALLRRQRSRLYLGRYPRSATFLTGSNKPSRTARSYPSALSPPILT